MLRVVRGETGDVRWMAFASGLPPGWRARTRSDAARRGARPDHPPNPPRTGGLGGAYGLPAGARRLGDTASKSAADEASILAETGVRLVPVRRATMRPHAWVMDDIELRAYRHPIETVNRHLEKMGIERLDARPNAGFERKVHATLIALICTNMN
jgi:transposase, IS4 family